MILDEGGPDVLLKALPIFRELQDAAPDDIRDDWKIVVSGLTALEAALEDAGVDPATYDRDDPPEGLSDAEKDRIDAAAEELRDPGLRGRVRRRGAAGARRLQDAAASLSASQTRGPLWP